jgi:hypothetical protein
LAPALCLVVACAGSGDVLESTDTSSLPGLSALDRSRVWCGACESAVTERVQNEVRGADHIRFAPETEQQWQVSKAETGVRGRGQYSDAGGKSRDFAFECIYDVRKGRVISSRYW